jgi:hypothetical protein
MPKPHRKITRKPNRAQRHAEDALPRILVDINEVATALAVTPWTVRSWIEQRVLKPVLLPSTRRRRPQDTRLKRVLFDVADIRSFIAQMKETDGARR